MSEKVPQEHIIFDYTTCTAFRMFPWFTLFLDTKANHASVLGGGDDLMHERIAALVS